MKNFKLKNSLFVLFISLSFIFSGCMEEQVIPELTILEEQSKSGTNEDPFPYNFIDTTQISTVYVRWDSKVLPSRRDEIRATYSDVNGYMYLVSYSVCPNDPNVEIWQVIFNKILGPKDKTPDPLSTIPDEDGEMEKPTFTDLCTNTK